MMRAIKNWQIDLFAVPITLNHEGREKAKSRHGIFLTLLFAGFILWFIYSLSKEMFDKQNPNTITYDTFQEIPDPLELNKETFPFAVGVQLPSSYGLSYFMDEEVYHPVIKLLVFTNEKQSDGSIIKNREIIDVDIEPCTYAHFGSAWRSVQEVPLSSLYCINPKQTNLDKIEVAGIEDLTTYKAFYIGIQQCYNTSTITCKSDADMKDMLTRSWFSIFYLQSAINPQNFSQPNQRFVKDFSTMLSPTMLKSGIINLNHLEVTDDDGWLFPSTKTKSYIKVDTPTEYFDLEPDEDGFLYSGIFQLGQLKTTYERKYTRLQTVLAQIQGSAATVILVLIILLRPYSEVKFRELLINELFDVKIKKRDSDSANAKNNSSKNVKKKKGLPGDLKLHKYSSMEGTKQAPQQAKSPKNTAQEFEIKPVKLASQEVMEGNQYLSLASDRPLRSPQERNEEEKALTTKVQSFKTILNSIENENGSPDNQKLPQTLDKMGLLESVAKGQQELSSPDTNRRKSRRGQSLAIDKPDKIKLTALSDVISNGPDSPRKLSDISLKEEEKEGKQEDEAFVENDQKDYLQLSSPPTSPQNATERQDLVALELAEVKQDDEIAEGEELDETQDEDTLNYESSKIDISIWEFFSSYIKKTDKTKEKFDVLNKGMKNVRERMDILNIMKKFRELDKLKALLLEEDQLTLFNAMPKAIIKSSNTEIQTNDLVKSRSFSQRILKKSTFIETNEKQEEIKQAHGNIQMKAKKSKIDSRLLELYKNMLLNKNN